MACVYLHWLKTCSYTHGVNFGWCLLHSEKAMPPKPPPARCTSFMARSLSRKISQFYDDQLAPSGLRGTQFNMLVQARRAKDGPLTVTRLAELLNTDRTTLTRNLQTLQAQGLIEVVAGADARSRCV